MGRPLRKDVRCRGILIRRQSRRSSKGQNFKPIDRIVFMDNRRLAPRYDLTSAVAYRGVPASGRGSVISLSEGSFALQANTAFHPREPLTLLISIGLGKPARHDCDGPVERWPSGRVRLHERGKPKRLGEWIASIAPYARKQFGPSGCWAIRVG